MGGSRALSWKIKKGNIVVWRLSVHASIKESLVCIHLSLSTSNRGVMIHRWKSIHQLIGERSMRCIDAAAKHRCISLYYTLLFWQPPCVGVCETISAQVRQAAHESVHRLNEASSDSKRTCEREDVWFQTVWLLLATVWLCCQIRISCFSRLTWLKVAQLGGKICNTNS